MLLSYRYSSIDLKMFLVIFLFVKVHTILHTNILHTAWLSPYFPELSSDNS
jgi:hypothetical protein